MTHHGDCLEVMAGMEPESVDAVVTDPPYGLEFMGKAWDKLGDVARANRGSQTSRKRPVGESGQSAKFQLPAPAFDLSPSSQRRMQVWHEAWAREAFRVAKPSAYLLAFGGTRTVHRMTVAIEDAGWIIRDMLVWAYASGFPKSKASLKPAWEPIVMARKPGPLRMLAIDECRIPTTQGERDWMKATARPNGPTTGWGPMTAPAGFEPPEQGRWPANVILTDPIFDGGWEGVVGGGEQNSQQTRTNPGNVVGESIFGNTNRGADYLGDSGTYSRFFVLPKAGRTDREPVLGGLAEVTRANGNKWTDQDYRVARGERTPGRESGPRGNTHPTVKPVDLMRHLVRLVTPTGGTVLDPFLGSGTTAIAAEMEGFDWIGIEKEAEYVAIAEARLNGTQRGLGLPA